MRAPWYLAVLARVLLPAQERELVLGDLEELYVGRRRERGSVRALISYLHDRITSAIALRRRRGGPRLDGPTDPAKRGSSFEGLLSDAVHAARSIRRQPGFALMVVATLALGLGPTAAVFGMVEQLVLRPLPGVANTQSAAYLLFSEPGLNEGLTIEDFDAVRAEATLVEGVASYGAIRAVARLESGQPIAVAATTVYGDYFDVLGVRPVDGRLLTAADTELDANPLVAVIGEGFRDRVFGPGDAAVGRTLDLNGQPVEVVGVAGGGFRGATRSARTDVWVPHSALVPLADFPPERLSSRRSAMHYQLLVRPTEGATHEAIESQVDGIMQRLAASFPESAEYFAERKARVYEGLHTDPLARERTNGTLRMMGWVAGLLLAIACANVANLLLFRNLARRGAVATLRALGASAGRLTRQHVIESLFFGFLGGGAAIGVAWAITLPLRGQSLVRMPAFEGLALHTPMMLFIAALAVATALLFGAAPAALVGRFDLGDALRATRAQETGRIGPLRTALSAGQVGLTLALLVGGLLMVRTLQNLNAVDTGLDTERIYQFALTTGATLGPEQQHAEKRALLADIAALPGVEGVALDLYGPHGSRFMGRVGLPSEPLDADGRPRSGAVVWEVTPQWFNVFGVAPIDGRTFRDDEWTASPEDGVVLTASLARRLFGTTDVAGQHVLARTVGDAAERPVIGVVGDYTSMADPNGPTDALFILHGEVPFPQMSLMVKLGSGSSDTLEEIQGVLQGYFPDDPMPSPAALGDRVESLRSEQRMLGMLLWTLGGFAVLLAGVGLYGVIFFIVSKRKREFGIRVALGADALRILELVARSAVTIIALGSTGGMVAAYALSRVLRSQLFGVGTVDVASYVGAAGLLAFATALACAAPARYAMAVDPSQTLREE